VHPALTAVLGVALVLVAGELVARQWLISPSVTVHSERYGWVYPPHVRVVQCVEGWSVARTNSLGLLDDEPRVPRAPLRALLLGDSYAAALQVGRRDNYQSVAERCLPGLEVVNAGSVGKMPLDYANWLADQGSRLAPDIVVVQVDDGDLNDLLAPSGLARLDRPPPARAAAGAPSRESPMPTWRSLARRSALATAIWQRVRLIATDREAHPTRPFHPGLTATARRDPFADPRLPAVLDSVQRRLAAHAPRLIYLYLPTVDYFASRATCREGGGAAVWRAFAARNHVTLVDMFEPFRDEFERTGQPLHGFPNSVVGRGHINAAGHRVTGERLARAIAEAMR
jgi:lysophospholipase L1-like esterase